MASGLRCALARKHLDSPLIDIDEDALHAARTELGT
jgi:hypothetical protein